MVDKTNTKMENVFRIEVWVKFCDDKIAPAREIRDYLTNHFAQSIYEYGESSINQYRLESEKDKWV